MKILVINPGSTSTKVAVYEDETELFSRSLPVDLKKTEGMKSLYDQLDMRTDLVRDFLAHHRLAPSDLSCVVARGGMLPPVKTGAYLVDERLCDLSRNHPAQIHASNLGALIADSFAKEAGIPAYIYDPVTVDELSDIARLSGIKGRDRSSYNHVLNTRSVALRHCREKGLEYAKTTLIVVHLGGGISVNVQQDGRITDVSTAEEGPFSSERAGGLQVFTCVAIAREEGPEALRKYESGKGGLVSYLGTNDARDVEKMIAEGNEEALTVYRAMAYQVAKAVGSLATVVRGKLDGILLTGGIAFSKMLTGWITEAVEWIAPVYLYPGEFEMLALAQGAYRVLTGQEQAQRI